MDKGGVGRALPCTPLSTPPTPRHFYLTEPSWKHTFLLSFMVLINAWVTGPRHSPEILEFCPMALTTLSRMHTTALALARPFCCRLSQYLLVTYTQVAASCSQGLSVLSLLIWGWSGRKETSRKMRCMTSAGRKHSESSEIKAFTSTTQSQYFMACMLYFQWGSATNRKNVWTQHSRSPTLCTLPSDS